MGRPGITKEQVFEASSAIAREGQTPTVVLVRTRLGGGSPNNITKWLNEWKESNEIRKVESLPPLPEGVESAMRQVWGAAWKDAQAQLEGEREALNTARKDIEQERNQMLAEIERLDGDLDQARDEIRAGAEALEQERREHDRTKGEVREAIAVATERSHRIQAQESELRETRHRSHDAEAKASRLEADLAHANRETERERERQAEIQRQADRLQADLARVQGEAERLKAELESAQRHAKEARAIADTAGKKVQKLETALDEERQARAGAEKVAADLRVEAATLAERAAHAEELRGLVNSLQKQTPARNAPTKNPPQADT
jgi:chromosome segregation ATPase